jgi:hypothetical protein
MHHHRLRLSSRGQQGASGAVRQAVEQAGMHSSMS